MSLLVSFPGAAQAFWVCGVQYIRHVERTGFPAKRIRRSGPAWISSYCWLMREIQDACT